MLVRTAKNELLKTALLISRVALMLALVTGSNGCTHLLSHRVHVSEINSNRYELIGKLGVPLGRTVRTEAIVVDEGMAKKDYGSYLLDIISVNGNKLNTPLRMSFNDMSHRMPSDHFKRYEDVEGHPTGGLNNEIVARLNKGYVGNRYDLLIYEEAFYTGFTSPEHPIHFTTWQGNICGIKTIVVILQVYGVNESIRPYKVSPSVPLLSILVTVPAGINNGIDPDFGDYSLTNAVSFCMDSTEVTKGDWDKVYAWALKHGYCFDNIGSGKSPNHPVIKINWYDCLKWCNARSEKDGKTPCYTISGKIYKSGQYMPDCDFSANGYRLPTVMEWEYAARGGLSGKRFPWGDTITHRQANYVSGGNVEYDKSLTDGFHPDYYQDSDDDDWFYTSPAGSFAPNDYGLFDMAGNVKEWCWDSTAERCRDVRGGSWWDPADDVRCGYTNWGEPAEGYLDSGFRSVCRP